MPEGPSIVLLKEQAGAFSGRHIRSATGNSKIDMTRLRRQRILSLRSSSAMIGLTPLAATSSALEQHIQAGDLPAARTAFRAVDTQVGPARLAVAAACTRLG